MKIFLDSANLSEIKDAYSTGLIDGVTTNPTLISKNNTGIIETIEGITSFLNGPISVEVLSIEFDKMIDEALTYSKISKNIVIKIPVTRIGFKVAQELYKNGINTNMTLCFSPLQALFAAKSNATYISPFIGRLDDIGTNGIQLINDISNIYKNYNVNTLILAASIRTITHIIECAKIGVDCITIPFKLFEKLFENHLTKNGLDIFINDWNHSLNK